MQVRGALYCEVRIIFMLSIFFLTSVSSGYSQKLLSLEDAIRIAKGQSAYFHRAKNGYERAYWRFTNFRASFRPQIRMNATTPTFYRAINPIVQPDGSIQFVRVNQANNTVGLSILQNVGFLGGKIRASSSLQRTDNFSGNQSSYFLSTPLQLSYVQSSLLYNEFYWQKKIEPLRFDIAKRIYDEDIELAGLEATKLFLDAFAAQLAVDVANSNVATTDTLYRLAEARFLIGTVPQTDVLQLQLNLLKARNEMSTTLLRRRITIQNLNTMLGLVQNDSLKLSIPPTPQQIFINCTNALEFARTSRSALLTFGMERLLADQELAVAKGQNSLQISLIANIGTQQTAPNLAESYRNLQNQQYIGLTVDVPLQDWGYRKSQVRQAKANRDLVEVNMRQNELAFEQEVCMKVLQLNQEFNELAIAGKIDTVAQQRLLITKERYLLGKLAIPDLNLALQESAGARKAYIQALINYWLSFYVLRTLTLYDFARGSPINSGQNTIERK